MTHYRLCGCASCNAKRRGWEAIQERMKDQRDNYVPYIKYEKQVYINASQLTYNPRLVPALNTLGEPMFSAWLRWTDDFDVCEYTSMLAEQGYFDEEPND